MSDKQDEIPDVSDTLIISCPVCGSDDADTLGVTGPMDGSSYSVVVMICEDCSSVYLAPPPRRDSAESGADEVLDRVYGKHIRRQMQSIPVNSKFVSSDPRGQTILDRSPAAESFDIILLPLALESAEDPHGLLAHVADLLSDGGRVDIVLGNIESSCFGVFGGRHWFGFRFPDTRQHPGSHGVRRLASSAGLEVRQRRVAAAPNAWLVSARNWLRDWGSNRAVIGLLTGPWLVPWLFAAVIEGIAKLRGRGAVLVVSLEKGRSQ